MKVNNPFWNPPDLEEIDTQEEFYRRLRESDTLQRVLYRPDTLVREERGKKIESIKFIGCSLSKTGITGIIFNDCEFKDCLLIGSTINDCEFHRCTFENTNTYKITLESTYVDPKSFRRCLDKKKHQNIGVHLFQELLNNSRSKDQVIFEREAMFQFLRWKRFQIWYEVKQDWEKLKGGLEPIGKLLMRIVKGSATCAWRRVWQCLSGSGLRIRNFVASAVVFALAISCVNHQFGDEFGLSLNGNWSYYNALYFTIISLTTLGYGDITPTTVLGQMVASLQSIFGFVLFALLTSMLYRRLFP